MKGISVMGATGFVGSRYCQLYQYETTPEPRATTTPAQDDVLYLISTTTNYAALQGNLDVDVDTNLKHLLRVLPNVRGRFAYVSSWFTYGAAAGTSADSPAREDSPCDPNGFYSATKLCAEQLVRSYTQTAQAGLVRGPSSYQILRLCSVIGGDPKAGKQKNAIEYMVGQIARGDDVSLYTGDCYRSVMHVNDVCRAIKCVLDRGNPNEVYNIGPPQSVRVYDLLQHALLITKSSSRINLVAPPAFHRTVQVESFHMDTTKLRDLGFIPDMDAYEAVERVIANL